MSGLSLILLILLIIFILIPFILYTFSFLRASQPNHSVSSSTTDLPLASKSDLATVIVFKSEENEIGGGECPVCLSAFEIEEELWRLNLCNHLFHAPCIERWLNTHSDCPVCRAYVKPQKRSLVVPAAARGPTRRDDFWQGLPDSAGLV